MLKFTMKENWNIITKEKLLFQKFENVKLIHF
jgi:hypothetical protein